MRLVLQRMFLLVACLLLITSAGSASMINFSNLPDNSTPVPNGYAGFDWNNFYDMHKLLTPININPTTGVAPGMYSYAYNNGGAPAWFGSNNTFSLTSALLYTEWANVMGLQIQGLDNGNVVDSMTLALTDNVAQEVTFNWSGIDQVRFVPISPASTTGAPQFAVTNIIVNQAVPEPTSLFLLAPGLVLAVNRLRRMRLGS